MKKNEYWIARDDDSYGYYSLHKRKPEYRSFFNDFAPYSMLVEMSPIAFKKIFRIKNHLRKGTYRKVKINVNVKFVE